MTLNSSPAERAIKMTRGDEVEFDLFVVDKSVPPLPVDVTGLPFWFTAKASLFDADDDAVIAKDSVAGGVLIVDGPGGHVRVVIDPSDTEALEAPTTLRWDVQWADANAAPHTLDSGDLIIALDVTRRTV